MRKPNRFFPSCVCCQDDNSLQGPTVAGSRLDVSRRGFMASAVAGAVGAGGLLSGLTPVRAQAPAIAKRIDVHHHYVPQFQIEAMAATRSGSSLRPWTPEISLKDMDASGVSTAIVSVVQPGVWFGDVEQAKKLARQCNEYAAKMVRDYPGRFGFWAILPLPDVEGSLKEIEYALDVLKADGIGLLTSVGDKYLGDSAFAPVFDELNRRKAIVYTHPLTPNCCDKLVPGLPSGVIEYTTDTTRTIASLLFSGTAARCPDIKFIFSHSGGTLPFLTGRFIQQAKVQKYAFLPNGPIPELKKFFYEIAQGNTPGQLAALLKMAPMSQIMWGSDFPFRPGSEAIEGLADYGFSAEDLVTINNGNALKLLPRLKA
jgi:predicted TIM-barrel fold metal-dependent hydrolase